MGSMLRLCFWSVSDPCFSSADSRRFRHSVSICVLPGHCSGLCRYLAGMNYCAARSEGFSSGNLECCFFLLLLSVKVYRPFCQYLCPLGAIYGWFNRFSLVQIHWEQERCVSCGACERACPAALSLQEISCSPECIRCGKCAEACPADCLHFGRR